MSITKLRPDESIVGFLSRDRIKNLNILGILENTRDAECYIFDGGLDDGVIVRSDPAGRGSFLMDTGSKRFLKEFWDGLPSGEYRFCGIPEDAASILTDGRGEVLWQNPCHVYVLMGKFEYMPDNSFERFSLTKADAREVDRYYTYRSPDSLARIEESIENRDSEALRIDGELAAWILVHDDNSMGPLYVKEKFRGKRLAKLLTERISQKLIDRGLVPFCHIVEGNDASVNNIKKIPGFELSHNCVWFGLKKTK